MASVVVSASAGITALAFWFGWTITNARSSYFGIDASVLGYTATDYVLRSADAMMIPAIAVLVFSLAALAVHRFMTAILAAAPSYRAARAVLWTLLVAGLLAAAQGYLLIFQDSPVFTHELAAPVLLGAGVLVCSYSISLLHRTGTPRRTGRGGEPSLAPWERAMVAISVLLAVVCLFWGASLYAEALGVGSALSLERNLQSRPSVTVYSKEELALGEGVQVDVLGEADGVYRFRYSQLRLLTYSNDRHFLLTNGWSHGENGTAIVLKDSTGIRYEYRPESSFRSVD